MYASMSINNFTEQYDKLLTARTSLVQGYIDTTKKELVDMLDVSAQTLEKHALLYTIDQKLRELSLEIQGISQDIGIQSKKVEKVPHFDTTLRVKRLWEYMSYPDRLNFILAPEDRYAKLDTNYLDREKNKKWYKGRKLNKGAVEDRVRQDFFTDHFVIDTDNITDDMRQYLLDGKPISDFIKDPQLKSLKQKFARPYFLQYQLPGKTPEEKTQKKATSRIMFFRWSPAIAVFRSADTHPIVSEPTKHEQRKIQKGMDMYITNSSYDIISQQYFSIQHIMQDKKNITYFTQELKITLEELVKQQGKLSDEQKKDIELVMESLTYQVNPQILMARLYNLSKIPYFSNRVVQENLLQAAIRKMSKRKQDLWQYLYYMIPQLQALETIHQQNIDNMELLHLHALMCAWGNNPRAFVEDTHRKMWQFDKHNIFDKIDRAVAQHSLEQKDHLIGMFYTMHQEIGEILKKKDPIQKKQAILEAVHKHRYIMAAEKMKQDIQLWQQSMLIIDDNYYFGDVTNEGIEKNLPQREDFFAIRKKVRECIQKNDAQWVIRELDKYRAYISTKLQD